MAVAAAANVVLLIAVILAHGHRARSDFNRTLSLRASEVGREVATELQRTGSVRLLDVDEWSGPLRTGFEVHNPAGQLLAETPFLHGVALDVLSTDAAIAGPAVF